MSKLKVITVKLDSLIPDPKNANKMSEDKLADLTEIIRNFGMLQPILVTPAKEIGTYFIDDGHHRVEASRRAEKDEVLAVVYDGTAATRRLLSLAMNNLRGELDLTMVQEQIVELFDAGTPMELLKTIGWSDEDVDAMLSMAEEASPDDIMEDPMQPEREKDEGRVERPLVLELTFASSEELKKAKRGLRRAAGKGRELGEGLLALLGEHEE